MKYLYFLVGLIFLIPLSAHGASSELAIYAFQISGESAYDEFVAIKNYSVNELSLENYGIARKSKTSTTYNTLIKFGAINISPGQVLVVGHAKYTGSKDFVYSSSSYSVSADNTIAVLAPDKSVVDLVGLGESISFLGNPIPNPIPGVIYSRVSNTSNNLNDFKNNQVVESLDVNVDKLVISEILPNPNDGEEWIELFNATNATISLSGLKLCDAMGSVHCYFFPQNSSLGANEYKTLPQSVTKITLNNTGDWVELRDLNDNLLTDSGGNYGDADSGVSLSLFGSEYKWSAQATPGAQNTYIDTVEVEPSTRSTAKSTKKKVSTSKKTVLAANNEGSEEASDTQVLGESTKNEIKSQGADNQNKILGIAVMSLAVLLLFGYNLWNERERIAKYINRFSRRNR